MFTDMEEAIAQLIEAGETSEAELMQLILDRAKRRAAASAL